MSRVQLSQLVDHSDSRAVLGEVSRLFALTYDIGFDRIRNVYDHIVRLFSGEFAGYLGCNTEYHNLTHTMDVFLTAARLMDGKNCTETPFAADVAERLLIAALLHDTGYILEDYDRTGTGAKYTENHVVRSMVFAEKNADILGLFPADIPHVTYFISCTWLRSKLESDMKIDDEEKKAGSILGSADLLGQMSDRAYLEKLLFLYYEFREAGIPGYDTEFDILRKTLDFYELTLVRLNETLLDSSRYARKHFLHRMGVDENLYSVAIERQMDYLRTIIADTQTNFRHKLKRIDLETVETGCII
jgi:hypothetical protein